MRRICPAVGCTFKEHCSHRAPHEETIACMTKCEKHKGEDINQFCIEYNPAEEQDYIQYDLNAFHYHTIESVVVKIINEVTQQCNRAYAEGEGFTEENWKQSMMEISKKAVDDLCDIFGTEPPAGKLKYLPMSLRKRKLMRLDK
jgi:hypothetical protein